MLRVCLLGTAGQCPRPNRYLSSAFISMENIGVLIDCGEGTQMALSSAAIGCKKIDYICLTHYHSDHVGGLAGVLLAMSNQGRTEPVTLIGPEGLEDVYKNLTYLIRKLQFSVKFITIKEGEDFRLELGTAAISAFKLHHTVPCYGYNFEVYRKPKFLQEKAIAMGVPRKLWSAINDGNTVFSGGRAYTADMFYGNPRRGIKVSFCTDTRPYGRGVDIVKNVRDADLFICEAMYGSGTRASRAKETCHMFMQDAAKLAREAGVGMVWLTHFSPANMNPYAELDSLKEIMPELYIGRDGMTTELLYSEEEES